MRLAGFVPGTRFTDRRASSTDDLPRTILLRRVLIVLLSSLEPRPMLSIRSWTQAVAVNSVSFSFFDFSTTSTTIVAARDTRVSIRKTFRHNARLLESRASPANHTVQSRIVRRTCCPAPPACTVADRSILIPVGQVNRRLWDGFVSGSAIANVQAPSL